MLELYLIRENTMLRESIFVCVLLFPSIVMGHDHKNALTNEEVDKFLQLIPETSEALKPFRNKFKVNTELNEKVKAAASQGQLYRTIIEVVAGLNEAAELQAVVEKGGYESLLEWAYVGDRITSVHVVVEMSNALAPSSFSDFGFKDGDNVFEFVSDESKPVKVRNKLFNLIEGECAKLCVVPDDLKIVGPRIKEIAEALK